MNHYFIKRRIIVLEPLLREFITYLELEDLTRKSYNRELEKIFNIITKYLSVSNLRYIVESSKKDVIENVEELIKSIEATRMAFKNAQYCMENTFYIDAGLLDSIDTSKEDESKVFGEKVHPYDHYCICFEYSNSNVLVCVTLDKDGNRMVYFFVRVGNIIKFEPLFLDAIGFSKMDQDCIKFPFPESLKTPGSDRSEDIYACVKMLTSSVARFLLMLDRKSTKVINHNSMGPKDRKRVLRLGGEPTEVFKSLVIKLGKEIIHSESKDTRDGVEQGLHSVRAHTHTYTEEAPLFGKYIGTFIIPSFIKGNRKHGEIKKDYIIKK